MRKLVLDLKQDPPTAEELLFERSRLKRKMSISVCPGILIVFALVFSGSYMPWWGPSAEPTTMIFLFIAILSVFALVLYFMLIDYDIHATCSLDDRNHYTTAIRYCQSDDLCESYRLKVAALDRSLTNGELSAMRDRIITDVPKEVAEREYLASIEILQSKKSIVRDDK